MPDNTGSDNQRAHVASVHGAASGWSVYFHTGNINAGVWHWSAYGPRGIRDGTESTESVAILRARLARRGLSERVSNAR